MLNVRFGSKADISLHLNDMSAFRLQRPESRQSAHGQKQTYAVSRLANGTQHCSISVLMAESLHKLTDAEVRILISYSLKLIPAATLRDLQGSSEKRAKALDLATDVVVAQLGRANHELYRPEQLGGPLFG
jgi:hypothetical protein